MKTAEEQSNIVGRLERCGIVIGESLIAKKKRMPGEDPWFAKVLSVDGNDLFVEIVREWGGHQETWNVEHTIHGIRSGFYQVSNEKESLL